MASNWIRTLFLALGYEEWKRGKAEKARRAYLAERSVALGSAMTKLHEEFETLFSLCGPIGLGMEFVEQVKLAPFYPIGEVLSAQGEVAPEQEAILKIIFANRSCPYNYAQFTQAAIQRTGEYDSYWAVVGLNEQECGSLWHTVFELIYRTRQLFRLQKIVDQLTTIAIQFSALADENMPYVEPICKRILNCLNKHVDEDQRTPHIHAILLLQQILLEQFNWAIEEHFLLRGKDATIENETHHVYEVYRKDTQTKCGEFAVRLLPMKDGQIDLKNQLDRIFQWDDAKSEYRLIFEE